MKPFDLEAAKRGEPVVTRDGRPVRIICFDANSDAPIVALVQLLKNVNKDNDTEYVFSYDLKGRYLQAEETELDLMMK